MSIELGSRLLCNYPLFVSYYPSLHHSVVSCCQKEGQHDTTKLGYPVEICEPLFTLTQKLFGRLLPKHPNG
eukprot:scaffold344067_cov32-Prasinocladus_malaysianus.AAC.1